MINLKIKQISLCLAAFSMTCMSVSATSLSGAQIQASSLVIPKPAHFATDAGVYVLPSAGLSYVIHGSAGSDFTAYLDSCSLRLTPAARASRAGLVITIRKNARLTGTALQGYELRITPRGIRIEAPSETGAFYAMQTLFQLTRDGRAAELPCCTITDSPRFGYRGVHFDVSRHFRSPEFLMKQMDAMALLKMNRMHLHLTDGAGWRLQIDAYPRLTDFAAWRPYRRWSDWWAGDRHYCDRSTPGAYGGYYTKDDIRRLLAYARRRHIEIIPEIEMPGHSEEVLAAYPELSCQGKPYTSSDFCVGKEETFTFLTRVLSEVMELFPSQYIHIGGDEAAKSAWKECPDCQKRMKQEGLKDVDELQSYLIHRIERFVNDHGKKIIGWDEILQGGLAPNATVMSWRGTEGGLKALRSGHDVIMTPSSNCYLDYAQDAPFKEPISIGGYLPLQKVYSYEPIEKEVTPEQAKHLIGLQANLWTEYITEDSHAEYMYYPRTFAIAETAWTTDTVKNYPDFRCRALQLDSLLMNRGYHVFPLEQEYGERKESLAPLNHLGKGAHVIYNLPYSNQYPAAGEAALTDGVRGGWTYGDHKWQGTMKDFDVTVDLGKIMPVHYVGTTFMQSAGAWVYLPERVEVSVSDDGKSFRPVDTVWRDVPQDEQAILFKLYAVTCREKARYIRVHAVKNPKAGAWLFTDEVVIN